MKEEDLFKIAKIIDNDYIGKRNTFNVTERKDYYYLSSGICDEASMIRVYFSGKITRLGPDTGTWQEIHRETYKNVNNFLAQQITMKG